MIFIMLGLLPAQAEDLTKALEMTSKYARISFKKKKKDEIDHVIILGNT